MASKKTNPPPKGRAILVASSKGGAGKTLWSRGYLDTMRTRGYTVAAYDGDGQVGQLIQNEGLRDNHGHIDPHQLATSGVTAFDIRDEHARDTLMNAVEDARAQSISILLFDLPGGSIDTIAHVIDERDPTSLLRAYRDHGYMPTIVVPITPMIASIRAAKQAAERFGEVANIIAVKNAGFAAETEFPLYDGTTDATGTAIGGKAKAAVERVGGQTIVMPRFRMYELSRMDMESMSIAEAVNDRRFGLAERQRIAIWRRTMDQEIASASAHLGMEAGAKTAKNETRNNLIPDEDV